MQVLIAFDKFKDALTAPQACDLAARVLKEKHPKWLLDVCPLADGGDGFASILTRSVRGEIERRGATGPRGGKVEATLGLVSGHRVPRDAQILLRRDKKFECVAIIELATASGLALLPAEQRDPWQTTTLGTGELMLEAARAGADALLLGVGGSATHDLGLGILAALGLQFLTAGGERVHPPIPARWKEIAQIGGNIPDDLPPIYIACDVTNPLLGPNGAAAVYGPQKGLLAHDLARLEHESARIALLLCTHFGRPDALMDAPGAGAAGGTPFGLNVAANARVLSGADVVHTWLNIDSRIMGADLVITGEGRFDESSLSGKGPGSIITRTLVKGIPTHVFAGEISTRPNRRDLMLHAITAPGTPLETALRDSGVNLANAVRAAF